jgi:beta-1,4-mannosyl-glycoprotein beta-1,4-N-acetylglucosaminyltransferase
MIIVDNFMFNNDAELLELRYHMLKDVVDYFVISEANHTFTGIPKEFTASKLIDKLGLDANRFIVLEVDTSDINLEIKPLDLYDSGKIDSTHNVKNFTRLRTQKDALVHILDKFPDDTIFIHSDVDEIMKPETVRYIASVSQKHPNNIVKIPLVLLESSADCRVYNELNEPVQWNRSLMFCTKQQLKHKGCAALRSEFENPYPPITITENGKVVEDLGWHFTWMGDTARKKNKLKSTLHSSVPHLINNVTESTKALMKDEIKTFGDLVQYHHKPYDLNLLPKEIFHLPRVKKLLLPNYKQVKIVDYTMYFNEIELFELRYHMLKDVVDLFVVSESDVTFAGNKKEFNLENELKKLNIDSKKVRVLKNKLYDQDLTKEIVPIDTIHSSAANDKSNVLAWVRERKQRDSLYNILNEFDEDTVFIVNDVDEIINPSHIKYLARVTRENPDKLIKIPLVLLEGQGDRRLVDTNGKNVPWDKSMYFALLSHFRKEKPNTYRSGMQPSFPIVYIAENNARVEDLGWHFTWMGDTHKKLIKATNYGHAGNLNAVNNISKETAELLESNLSKNLSVKRHLYKEYDKTLLPKQVFELPNVEKFLFPNLEKPNQTFIKLHDFLNDPNNPITNFWLGYEYDTKGQTAAAVSYYLRAAERTDDIDLQYESLIRMAKCFERQRNRNFTVSGLYNRAITVNPKRPEAYYLFAEFHYNNKDYQASYLYATIGLSVATEITKPLTELHYPGLYGIEYLKAINAWYNSFYKQSKETLISMRNRQDVSQHFKNLIEHDLQHVVKV